MALENEVEFVAAAERLYVAANWLYEAVFLELGAPRLRELMSALNAYEKARS